MPLIKLIENFIVKFQKLLSSLYNRYAYDKIRDLLFKYLTPKMGIEKMNKEPGGIEI